MLCYAVMVRRCGVIGCFVLEFVLLRHPEWFSMCFVAFIVPLLLLRLLIYRRLKWHYFLLDHCYVSNASCLAQVLLWPESQLLMLANFAHANGPLALAIPTWRNSLVFHSLDKITSSYVHGMPAMLTFCLRWYPPPGVSPLESIGFGETMKLGVGAYMAWQLSHLIVTEIFLAKDLRSHPDYGTSIRWLTAPPYAGISKVVHVAMREIGVMGPSEMFDSEHWKTKLIFISVQGLYTTICMVPVVWLWGSFYLHLGFLLLLLVWALWNGANYYIEVFSKAYRKQFEGGASLREMMGDPMAAAASASADAPAAAPADAPPADADADADAAAASAASADAIMKKEQ